MVTSEVLDWLPLWALFPAIVAVILLAIEVGYQVGYRDFRRSPDIGKVKTGTVVGAGLGLLAFILAFTFGSTTTRFDARKELVLAEVNAIGTAYLRADLLTSAERDRAQGLLRQYTEQRYELVLHHEVDRLQEVLRQAGVIQHELWLLGVEAAWERPTPTTALFVAALNDVFDLHQERLTLALERRMPPVFWGVLFVLASVTMVLTGYDSGLSQSARRRGPDLLIAIAFSLVLVLVIALDRPFQTMVRVGQQPFADLLHSMGAAGGGSGPGKPKPPGAAPGLER